MVETNLETVRNPTNLFVERMSGCIFQGLQATQEA